ncbi:hypothetical protein [Atlantibacter hermannii]|uniref:hypothetical protein n=1 Tax=Atlantibacter hermannii TaxID=565 RepID=UPI00289F3863|nr:hypothetical protein [Atlantibacter hermannii]
MTTNNKHLVDSGREFAAKFDIHTAIIDIVRIMADLTEALAAEIKRSEALVVENAGLKECAVNYVHAVALWNSWADAEDKISPVLETPATDAFLAEVQAQGVEGIYQFNTDKVGVYLDGDVCGLIDGYVAQLRGEKTA